MIVKNQKIEVPISKRNIGIYKKRGYKDLKVGETLFIDVKDLTKGSRIKVDVECDYCHKIIKVAYKDYVNYKFDKYSCEHCRQKKTSEYNLIKRQDSLYQRALAFCNENNYILMTDKSEILTSDTIVRYKCQKHGIHNVKIYNLITEHGCPDCAIELNALRLRKNIEDVYNDFKRYGGILLNKEEYLGWNYKNLKVICVECGEIFTTSYCAFMQHDGQRCPKCASNISRGEYSVKCFLEENDLQFYMQFRFDDCKNIATLPFDFYLPNHNIAIEYDGEHHYKAIPRGGITDLEAQEVLNNIKKRDLIKTSYCEQNNIKLIRIPYWDFDNINNVLSKELFT